MSTTAPPPQLFRRALFTRLFSYVRPYRRSFYLSACLAFLISALIPLRPWLIQLTLSVGLDPLAQPLWLEGKGAWIIEITILQIALLSIETLARYAFGSMTASLGFHVVRDLRNTLFRKVLSLEMKSLDRTPVGLLTTRTINDMESVSNIFSDGFIPILADMLTILSVIGYMCYIDTPLALICLSPFPLLLLATYIFKESVNRSFLAVRNAVGRLNSFVNEHLTGMPVVQAFAREQMEQERFSKINAEHREANIRSIFAYSVFFPLVELFSALSIGLLAGWAVSGSQGYDSSDSAQTSATITSFVLCLQLLFRPLRIIADKFNVLQMGMIAGERVFGILDQDSEREPTDANLTTRAIPRFRGELTFRNVSFSYQDGEPVLQDVSLHLPAGKTMALVGGTGSGKTTLISLLNGLYPLHQGSIEIDGTDIREWGMAAVREQVAVVLQDVFLFSGTIHDNLCLFRKDLSQETVRSAAREMGLDAFIQQLPGGYDFDVMERGQQLSSGQRQLISFARALLFNPSILILDEATSSVDSETERILESAREKLTRGRTALIIAHRLSTVRHADQILVLDKGRVVETGTHQQLMDRKGKYYELYMSFPE